MRINHAFEHAKKVGATNKGLITFTFNVVSQGLYIRHGLFPRLPIYLFSVVRDALMTRLQGDKLRSTPIEPTASHLKALAQLDGSARLRPLIYPIITSKRSSRAPIRLCTLSSLCLER